MMTATLSPTPTTSTSSKRPPWMIRLMHERERLVSVAAGAGRRRIAAVPLTSGSSSSPIASRSPRSAASKPRRPVSTAVLATLRLSRRQGCGPGGPPRLASGAPTPGASDGYAEGLEFELRHERRLQSGISDVVSRSKRGPTRSITHSLPTTSEGLARGGNEKPAHRAGLSEAADGTRTHDLLHGNQKLSFRKVRKALQIGWFLQALQSVMPGDYRGYMGI
jgi:hypothetical protein